MHNKDNVKICTRDPWFIQSACGQKYWESHCHLSNEYLLIPTAIWKHQGKEADQESKYVFVLKFPKMKTTILHT